MQYSRQRIKTEGTAIYNPTHLYEPLRNAIKKSTIFDNYNTNHSNNLGASNVSHYNKSYSNVSKMRGEVIIPNKALVATQNMQRVRGKTFTTVNIQERVGNPLSEEQFLRYRTGEREQIVYEIKQEGDQIKNVFTYTAPKTIKGIQTYAKKSQIPPNQSAFKSNKMINQFTPQQKEVKTHHKSSSTKVEAYNFDPPTQKKYEYSYNEAQNQIIIQPNKVKSYIFTSSKRREIPQRQVEQKKYNLFSVLDECGNNGCHNQCWKGNQICAPKIEKKGWK